MIERDGIERALNMVTIVLEERENHHVNIVEEGEERYLISSPLLTESASMIRSTQPANFVVLEIFEPHVSKSLVHEPSQLS